MSAAQCLSQVKAFFHPSLREFFAGDSDIGRKNGAYARRMEQNGRRQANRGADTRCYRSGRHTLNPPKTRHFTLVAAADCSSSVAMTVRRGIPSGPPCIRASIILFSRTMLDAMCGPAKAGVRSREPWCRPPSGTAASSSPAAKLSPVSGHPRYGASLSERLDNPLHFAPLLQPDAYAWPIVLCRGLPHVAWVSREYDSGRKEPRNDGEPALKTANEVSRTFCGFSPGPPRQRR
jgi:hypothetical protein